MTPISTNPSRWGKVRTEEKPRPKLREAYAIEKGQGESPIDGPSFWKRFVDRAMLDMQAMPRCKGEKLTGGVSASTTGVVRDCTIHVSRHSIEHGSAQSKMNFWYSPGDRQIQCWYQRQRMNDVGLVVRRHELHAAVAGKLLTPERFADEIVTWLVGQVRVGRQS